MPKTRLNISLDEDLADFIKIYARENRTTASEVILAKFDWMLHNPQNFALNRFLYSGVLYEFVGCFSRYLNPHTIWPSIYLFIHSN